MAIADDFSIAVNGDIRYTGSGTTYTVLELHRFLQSIADDASVSNDDLLDIASSTPSDRATDNIISLINGYNIDDIAARYLYDGSITQSNGDVVYSGLVVVGAVEAGTELQLVQNNQVLVNYWGTGLNADAAANILLRLIIKTRTGGADIDGKRIRVQARELSDSFAEFLATLGSGNSTAAIFTGNDLNNQTATATIAGWTDIVNTEGLRLIDVDSNTVDEEYYSEWDKASRTINQLYERSKWLSKRAVAEHSNADTGNNFTLNLGGNTGFGQSFLMGANAMKVTRVRARLKKTGSPTGNLTAKIYTHSGSFGSSSTPNVLQATSENLDVSTLTTSYQEVEIRFLGSAQFEMAAATHYVVTFEYAGGDGSHNVQIEGDTTGTHAGNKSTNNGGWTANAAEDLWFKLFASPKLYGMSGELFRGVTHHWAYDTEAGGPFTQNEIITWGSGATAGSAALLALDDDGATGNMYVQLLTGVVPTDPMTLTGASSGATAEINGSVTSRTVSPAFLGQSTGSAIIGAYGVGIEAADLTASDLLFDLTNTPKTPPNNVTFTVGGLVVGEDRVLVTWEDGGGIDLNQLTLNTTLNGAGETAVVLTGAIPSDTPATGTIRIQLDNGTYRRVAYTAWTGSTFTIAATDFTGANVATAPRNVFISYIDKLATGTSENFTVVFNTTRSLFIRVRDGGGTPIKTFETTGSLGAAGGSTTAIRQSDA